MNKHEIRVPASRDGIPYPKDMPPLPDAEIATKMLFRHVNQAFADPAIKELISRKIGQYVKNDEEGEYLALNELFLEGISEFPMNELCLNLADFILRKVANEAPGVLKIENFEKYLGKYSNQRADLFAEILGIDPRLAEEISLDSDRIFEEENSFEILESLADAGISAMNDNDARFIITLKVLVTSAVSFAFMLPLRYINTRIDYDSVEEVIPGVWDYRLDPYVDYGHIVARMRLFNEILHETDDRSRMELIHDILLNTIGGASHRIVSAGFRGLTKPERGVKTLNDVERGATCPVQYHKILSILNIVYRQLGAVVRDKGYGVGFSSDEPPEDS